MVAFTFKWQLSLIPVVNCFFFFFFFPFLFHSWVKWWSERECWTHIHLLLNVSPVYTIFKYCCSVAVTEKIKSLVLTWDLYLLCDCVSTINRLMKESEVTQSCPTLCDPVDCRLLGIFPPWDSPGKSTGVGYHFLLQGIFLTQGSNPGLPHCFNLWATLIAQLVENRLTAKCKRAVWLSVDHLPFLLLRFLIHQLKVLISSLKL